MEQMASSIVAKPLRIGEIAIVEKDWLLTFKCDYCQKEIKKFKHFLQHSLAHFFEINANEIELLYKNALDEPVNTQNSIQLQSTTKEGIKDELIDTDEELEFLYREAIAEAENSKHLKVEADEDDEDDLSVYEEFYEATDDDDDNINSTGIDIVNGEIVIEEVVQDSKETFEKVYLSIQKCDEAVKTTSNKDNNTKSKDFLCPFCEKSFANNQNLTYHIRRHTTKYPCDRCDAVFNDVNNHRRHYARHLGKKPHSCKVCDKRFLTTTELKKHARTHSTDRPFSCDECGATFRSFAGYEIHQRKHTNTRPFECTQCDKAFFEKRQLEDHIKLHSKEFPYECAECGKHFKTRRPYQAHCRTIHSDKKVFECQNCPEVFQERIELFWHLKRNHWKKTNKNATININHF